MLNLALAAFLVLPQAAAPATALAASPAPSLALSPAVSIGTSPSSLDSLFPTPSGPLTLEVGDSDSGPTLESLVRKYCELTGQNVVTSQDTQSLMKQMRINLVSTLTVPADEVQTTFELLLRQKDFALRLLKKDGVRLLEIVSLSTSARNNLRSSARYLAPEDLALARLHPAILFTTVVNMPSTDVRQMSNSMRTMITDANTQQMLPAGNTGSMVLVGFGDSLSDIASALQTIEETAAAGVATSAQSSEAIRLENAKAADIADLLNRALGLNAKPPHANAPKILSDERSNSLLITASLKRLADIKDLIAVLDTK